MFSILVSTFSLTPSLFFFFFFTLILLLHCAVCIAGLEHRVLAFTSPTFEAGFLSLLSSLTLLFHFSSSFLLYSSEMHPFDYLFTKIVSYMVINLFTMHSTF